jgi:two-component system, cell cycle response regulator DivK
MRKQILCIEDNSSNMTLISRIVEAEGHDLIRAEDGHLSLTLLESITPDLILLDVNIPGVNGLEIARRISVDERLGKVPLIAITANVLVGDRERCLEAGCDEYLPNPLDIKRLRELMRQYLSAAT